MNEIINLFDHFNFLILRVFVCVCGGGGGGVDSFIGSACVLHIKERSRGLMSNILSLLSGCISCHRICYRSASLGTDPFFHVLCLFYILYLLFHALL